MIWQLFWSFLMIGFVSFGGGYAMVPVIEREVASHSWMSTQDFSNVIAIAGMSPGPIATNSAIVTGYHSAGLLGAVLSALGTILPSFLIVILLSFFFTRVKEHKLTKIAFYGLRPLVTGLIVYAAIRFSITNGMVTSFSFYTLFSVLILIFSLIALIRFNMHPLLLLSLSGCLGILLYN